MASAAPSGGRMPGYGVPGGVPGRPPMQPPFVNAGYQTQPAMPPPRAGMPLPSSQIGSPFNPSTSYNQEQHFENGGHDVNSSSYDHKANFALITRREPEPSINNLSAGVDALYVDHPIKQNLSDEGFGSGHHSDASGSFFNDAAPSLKPAMPPTVSQGQSQVPQPGGWPGAPPARPAMQYPPGMGQQPPSMGQQPPLPSQQPPLPNQQPPLPNQQPPLPNQQPSQLGYQPPQVRGPPFPGQQPPQPGYQSSLPGQMPQQPQQPPLSSQQPPLRGPQPPLPGQQPFGQRPPMPGQQQPPLPGQNPAFPPQQPLVPGLGQQQSLPGLPPYGTQQQPSSLVQQQQPPPMMGSYQPPPPRMGGGPPGGPPGPRQPGPPPPMAGQSGMQQRSMGPPPMGGIAPPPAMYPSAPYGQQPGIGGAGQYMPPMPGQQPMMQQDQTMYQPGSSTPPPSPGVPQVGGYPPRPGAPGGFPQQAMPMGGRPAPIAQPQQQRRLDPDQIPSPIQVAEDDVKNRSGIFQTGLKSIVPPLVTTEFTVQDQGVCSPRFLRSTMYTIPCTSDMLKQSHMPFALSIVPFARIPIDEIPPPIVNAEPIGPVRCNRCKAYVCPYMQFIEGGRRFQCRFCGCNTEVPAEYFAHLDHTGLRVDYYDRPELSLGAYEFVATKEYCKNNQLPKAPAYIFMLEVSYTTVKSGLVQLLCNQMKEVLHGLPREYGAEQSEVLVAFVTYGKELHFFNLKSTLTRPQLMVVSDLDDMFVPLLDGFFVKFSESEALIDSLMAQIPEMAADCRETEVVLGPVIQAGLDALKSAERPGKLFLFHASLPSREAPGKLKARDDRKVIGTEKEKQLLLPQVPFYTKLGQECVAAGCGVEVFLFPNTYIDVATVAEVSRLTGGSIHKYTYFQADLDGERFIEDLKNSVSKVVAFDAVMRVRTSTGIRPVDFLGNFFMSNTTDVELAAIDCDSAVTVEIKHDDKLNEADGAYVQAAILYTSISGQRRLRVLNAAFNCCTQMADLFRSCELDVLINVSARLAIRQTLNVAPKQVREGLISQTAQVLACYRRQCTSSPSAGQLILPECMKLLPLYMNCLIHSYILQGGEIPTDERSYLIHLTNSMPVADTNVFFYPRLLPLHDLDFESDALPKAIRCSYERLHDTGIYLIENGLIMMMWVGMNANPEWVQSLFGVHSVAQIDIDKTQLQELDNPISRHVRMVIKKIRSQRNRCLKLTIVRQRDKLEPVFQQYLVEDRGASGTSSYVEYLCHIHKEIRQLLS